MNVIYESIKRLYSQGKLSKTGMANAIELGLITAEQYAEIVGEEYPG